MIGNFDQSTKKGQPRPQNLYMKMKTGRNYRRNDWGLSKFIDNLKLTKTITNISNK